MSNDRTAHAPPERPVPDDERATVRSPTASPPVAAEGRPTTGTGGRGRRLARDIDTVFTDQPVTGRDEWWRYALVLGLTAAVFAAVFAAGAGGRATGLADELTGGDQQLMAALPLFALFGLPLVVLVVAHRLVHRRATDRLLRSGDRWRLGRLAASIPLVLVPLGAVQLLFPGAMLTTGAPLAVVVLLLAVFVQVSMEEVLFRGYLLPRLARGFGRVAPAIVISAVSFTVLHLLSGSPLNLIVPLILGLFTGWWATRDDGLWVPIGAHYGLNAVGALVVADPDAARVTPSFGFLALAIGGILVVAVLTFVLVSVVLFPRSRSREVKAGT